MTDLASFLRSVDALAGLGDDELNGLAAASRIESFEDGQPIVRKGTIGRFLGAVYEGRVEVVARDDEGIAVLATLGRGAVFGEMSLMTGEPAMADVVAAGPARVALIPRETFSELLARSPRTLQSISRIIARRLVQREKDEAGRRSAAVRGEDPYDLNFTSAGERTTILVVNCGSSSLKYSLFDTSRAAPLVEGLVERIGSDAPAHTVATPAGKREAGAAVRTIQDALVEMSRALVDPATGAVKDLGEIGAVGHRVVHGGERFTSAVVVSDEVTGAIRACAGLAPLHNPYNLAGIEHAARLLPGAVQVAVFDTAFHQTMQKNAFLYALPQRLYETERVRRYGFHGISHKYASLKAAIHLGKPVGELKLISCHLGNGTSVCAVNHGRSVDTSMGMTPLEGLVMGTRCGDLDPGVVLHLAGALGLGPEKTGALLNRESGLLGMSGRSNDMRELLAAADAGDEACKTAVSVFCYRVKKYIGAYMAALGGVDAIVFTGGIGENSAPVRAMICQGMESLGVLVGHDANQRRRSARGEVIDAADPASRIRILVIPADEERMIARETLHALGRARPGEALARMGRMPVPLSVSAHHVHLCRRDLEALFGPGRELTPRAPLSQPGQFAAEETVNLVGPKGRVERVRILGPLRKASQVEISRTEEFKLGVDAPVRDSGDLEGTPGLQLEGPAGAARLAQGVICARRHIHMSAEEALRFGLRDRDVVMVKVKGARELIFGDVSVRVSPDFALDCHIDTDEANAAEISEGMTGVIEGIQSRAFM